VRHLEHHGHETLVSVDVGACGVEPSGLHELRTGELVLRVRPDVRPVHGEHVGVRLSLEQLHFFDLDDGRRIGPRGRRR
jgi:hypothetical protein